MAQCSFLEVLENHESGAEQGPNKSEMVCSYFSNTMCDSDNGNEIISERVF